MPPAGVKPTVPASEQLQIHVLERAATGILITCYREDFIFEIYGNGIGARFRGYRSFLHLTKADFTHVEIIQRNDSSNYTCVLMFV